MEKRILYKRINIQHMLSESFFIDFDKKSGCFAHFYKMDEKKYRDNKDFVVSFLLGDSLDKTDNCEAYFYNITDLISEHRLLPELTICSIPIPISKDRWKFLIEKYKNLSVYSSKEYVFDYPLIKKEIILMLTNLRLEPTICSKSSDCEKIDLKNATLLFDNMGENINSNQIVKWIESKDQNKQENKNDRVMKILLASKREVNDIFDFWNTDMEAELFSKKQKDYVLNMLDTKIDESCIISFIIESILASMGLMNDIYV